MKVAEWVPHLKSFDKELSDFDIPRFSGNMKKIANNILKMIPENGYWNYNSPGELEKIVIWAYWKNYDNLPDDDLEVLKQWFIHKATSPKIIISVFQDLKSSVRDVPYIHIKESVKRMAKNADESVKKNLGYSELI